MYKSLLSPVFLIFLSTFLPAQEVPETPTASKIDQVTVFTKGAQVQRTAEVRLEKGKSKLVFQQLSPYLNPSSIRVQAAGAFTLLSVQHRKDFLSERDSDARMQALQKQERALKDSLAWLSAFRQVLVAEQEMLRENRQIKGEATGISLENLQGVAEYYGVRMRELSRQLFELDLDLGAIDQQHKRVVQQLQEWHAQRDQPASEVILTIDAPQATSGQLEISYYVVHAGWTATYDLRAETVDQPVLLVYKANVFQQSGEDWTNVKLSFSNATPNESGNVPELAPFYLSFSRTPSSRSLLQPSAGGQISGRIVDRETGEPLIGATVMIPGTQMGAVSDLDGFFTFQAPPGFSEIEVSYVGYQTQRLPIQPSSMQIALDGSSALLEEVVVTGLGNPRARPSGRLTQQSLPTNVATYTTSVQFDLEIPFSVPSDGQTYTLELNRFNLPSQFEYRTVPKKEESAYLLAHLSDWKDYHLLPGESHLYFESTYVGRSYLDTRYAGDTLLLSLGKDRNIQISRERVKQFSKRQLIGSNQTESAAYRIWVRNNKSAPVAIEVLDQIPVSQQKEITVDIENLAGGKLDDATGQVKWNLQLQPGEEREWILQFSVKYPKDRYLSLE